MAVVLSDDSAGLDNAPGGSTCPPWLFLLDDPEPERVLVIGPADDPAAAWFADHGAKVDLRAHPGSASAAVDLVVISDGARVRSRGSSGLAACLAWCRPRAAVVVPWPARDATRAELAALGFDVVRPVRPSVQGTRRRSGFVALRSGGDEADGGPLRPPSWLAELAQGQPWSPAPGGWSLRVPVAYPSQKAVVRLWPDLTAGPAAIVKLTRHPRFNDRLENERTRLDDLARRTPSGPPRTPVVLGSGRVAGMAFVAEEAIAGAPFLEVSGLDAGCAIADDAVTSVLELATPGAPAQPGSVLAERLGQLLDRFAEHHKPDARVTRFLRYQIALLEGAELPSVVFHGDLGTWNLLVEDGGVRILDWESSEDPGPPLWDLAYFSRSYAVRAGRRRGLDRNRAIGRHLLGTSPLNEAIAGWFRRYTAGIGLDPSLVEPLFHTTWLHRAVKESARLRPGEPGHYGPLCSRLVLERSAPGLRRLVGP
ncbi:MAG TPA: aminoglycoside phosphotransferase family protein [Aquihabitans sp.]|jgi:hypothetical protein|nr:aminoglycoside phosphotransferase family protein [Aquihabitans sp.]